MLSLLQMQHRMWRVAAYVILVVVRYWWLAVVMRSFIAEMVRFGRAVKDLVFERRLKNVLIFVVLNAAL